MQQGYWEMEQVRIDNYYLLHLKESEHFTGDITVAVDFMVT